MNLSETVRMLEWPDKKVDVVFDSDTFNEVDDQYALAYMLRSSDKLNVEAIYAAPFFRQVPPFDTKKKSKSVSPADGMEKSYQEILKVLTLIGVDNYKEKVFHGSKTYLPSETEPVISDAALDLTERAMKHTPENPLYVIAIAAITDIASALIMKPEIRERMVVVWLGGNSFEWPDTLEFNLAQDVTAARVLFGCGVPLVLIPCKGVASSFTVSGPEINYWLKGKNKLCDYLSDVTVDYAKNLKLPPTWHKPIWDVTAVGYLIDKTFTESRLEHSPIPSYDYHYAFDKSRYLIRYVYHINTDVLLQDLFSKLAED